MPRGNPPRRKDDAARPAPSPESRQRGLAGRAALASMDSIRLGRDDELVLDADEHVVQAGAEQAGANDNGDADQGGDEAVFDGRRARLVLGKAGHKGLHGHILTELVVLSWLGYPKLFLRGRNRGSSYPQSFEGKLTAGPLNQALNY